LILIWIFFNFFCASFWWLWLSRSSY